MNTLLSNANKTALIPYITAGDPDPKTTLQLMQALADSGADIIELGVPFSDPVADGPVIQAAHQRALKHHLDIQQIFSIIMEFHQLQSTQTTSTPMVLMTYANPMVRMGIDNFATQAKQAGVAGGLDVDMPLEEGEELFQALNAVDIAPIFLISPNTSEERIKAICKHAKGDIYDISVIVF